MSIKKNDSVKFHVGKFSVTDQNGAMVVYSKVEKTKEYIDGVFWVEFHPFDKEVKSISILFDAIGLRTFANQLKELQYRSIDNVKKFSGGKKMIKSLIVTIIEDYSSFEFKMDKVLLFFRLPAISLTALAIQIEHLINTTMEATYKTQQFSARKKL